MASYSSLKKYMHVQSINGVSLDNRDVTEAARIIQETGDSEVQLMVRSSRRDVAKAERLRKRNSGQLQYAESPMEVQDEQFALVNQRPNERVVSTPRMSTASGGLGRSVSSDDSPVVEDVFRPNNGHKKPTDLSCVASITGVRQRAGDVFDEFRWEKDIKHDILIGGDSSQLGLSLTLVDFAVNSFIF